MKKIISTVWIVGNVGCWLMMMMVGLGRNEERKRKISKLSFKTKKKKTFYLIANSIV